MRWFPYLPPLMLLAAAPFAPGPVFGVALLLAVLLGIVELGRRYRDE